MKIAYNLLNSLDLKLLDFMIYFTDNNTMSLVDFLVTSNTRKDLLHLLWGEGVEASGHQLALLSKATYSTVHGELEVMKQEGLVTSYRKGRAEVFSKNNEYPSKRALLMLLEMPKTKGADSEKVSDEDVRANLARFGAPVVLQANSTLDLSLEDALVHGLDLARRDSTVARALPVAFARNKKTVDLARLEYLARKNKVLPVLGFYLELTAVLLKDKKLQSFAKALMDKRRKKMEVFFKTQKTSKYEQALVEKNTPLVARHWHFLMNMGMDSFESLFNKNVLEGEFT